jgi:expansin (peptidoglycan-binding protein)
LAVFFMGSHLGHHVLGGQAEVRQATEDGVTGPALDLEPLRLDPPVAVAGPAVLELDGVHHAVAVEQVVGPSGANAGLGPLRR